MIYELAQLYLTIDNNIQVVYVFPDIEGASKYNPYLSLLYKTNNSSSAGYKKINCISPHPLFPVFIWNRLSGEKNIVHYHWLGFSNLRELFVLLWKISIVLFYRITGGRIVWTVHNIHPHKNKYSSMNRMFYKLMAVASTRIHVHCREAIEIMQPILNVNLDKYYLIAHPFYNVNHIDKKIAIENLQKNMNISFNYDAPLFLVYGVISAYKGIKEIIEICCKNCYQLIVVGRFLLGEEEYIRDIQCLISGKKNIFIYNYAVSEDVESWLFNSIDAVLFNFKEILTSGSVILALSYQKDVFVPDKGCLKELAGDNIYKFCSLDEFEQKLKKYVNDFTVKEK